MAGLFGGRKREEPEQQKSAIVGTTYPTFGMSDPNYRVTSPEPRETLLSEGTAPGSYSPTSYV